MTVSGKQTFMVVVGRYWRGEKSALEWGLRTVEQVEKWSNEGTERSLSTAEARESANDRSRLQMTSAVCFETSRGKGERGEWENGQR